MLIGYMRVSKADGSQATDLQRGEDTEDQLAGGGRGVNGRAVPGQHLEADAASGQVMDGIDQMAQVAPEPIQFPNDQRVAWP